MGISTLEISPYPPWKFHCQPAPPQVAAWPHSTASPPCTSTTRSWRCFLVQIFPGKIHEFGKELLAQWLQPTLKFTYDYENMNFKLPSTNIGVFQLSGNLLRRQRLSFFWKPTFQPFHSFCSYPFAARLSCVTQISIAIHSHRSSEFGLFGLQKVSFHYDLLLSWLWG